MTYTRSKTLIWVAGGGPGAKEKFPNLKSTTMSICNERLMRRIISARGKRKEGNESIASDL